HDDGFRVTERRRRIQTKIQVILLRQGKRRDVLILRGVRGAENAYNIDNRSHISAVVAAARRGRSADLRQQISRRPGRQTRYHILTVRVVKNELIRILGKTGDLLRGGLIETLLLQAHVEAARQ